MPPERLAMHALDQAAVLELEPNLAPEAARGGAWFFERGWFLRDPAALLAAMRDGFARRGGEIRCSDEGITSGDPSDPGSRDTRRSGRVTSLASTADGTVRVGASDGSFVDAARVVVAAGARSADLARQCGDDVPLDTERGYHVQWGLEGEEEGGGVGARGRRGCERYRRRRRRRERADVRGRPVGGARAAGVYARGRVHRDADVARASVRGPRRARRAGRRARGGAVRAARARDAGAPPRGRRRGARRSRRLEGLVGVPTDASRRASGDRRRAGVPG